MVYSLITAAQGALYMYMPKSSYMSLHTYLKYNNSSITVQWTMISTTFSCHIENKSANFVVRAAQLKMFD